MSESLRSHRGRVVLALVLAAVAVLVAGLSGQRKIQSFQPIGFEAKPEAGHWRVTGVDSAGTALETGDQILLVNGLGAARLESLAGALRVRPESDVVVLRGEAVETLTYTLPPLEPDLPYLILAFIGLAYLLIGFYTLLRDRRRPALLFYCWCLASAVVYMVAAEPPFDRLGKVAYLTDELARIFLPALTLHLFAVFPRPLVRSPRMTRLVPFFYLPAAFLLLLQVDLMLFDGSNLMGGASALALAILDRLELFHLVAMSLAAAGLLAWRLRSKENESQRQATWIAVGMAAGYLPFLGLYVLPNSLGVTPPWTLTTLAVLPLGLVPLTFAYAILRYKLWDIGGIVRDAISLSLTVLLGVFAFALANLTVTRLVSEEMVLGRSLVTFLSGLTIAGLLVPARRSISQSLERIQYRGSFGRRRELADFGHELLRERNLDRLAEALAQRLQNTLALNRINLWLVHGPSLAPVRDEPGLPDLFPFSDFDRDFWECDDEVLTGIELPTEEPSVKQRLYGAGYRYALPLRVRDSAIGLVAIGYRDDDVPLSHDDLALVRNLLNQAALAIENAQLLHQVKRQLDEVVRLQQFSQGIIESSPAGIAVLEPDGRIRSANLAFATMAGIERRKTRGRRLRELLPIEPVPAPEEGIREVSFTDSGGRDRYLQVSVARLERGAPQELRVLVIQDVSERVEMENALKEKDRLASLGMLAAGVAHEVNTPITGISSYAQMLLADTPVNDPRHTILRKVEKQTFRAAQIVHNLLEFARNRQPEQGPVAIAPLLGECLEMQHERLEEAGIEIRFKAPDVEIVVDGNEGELLQVFTNLTVNAADAMSESGGRLTLEIEYDADWVWVEVQDTGPGIAPRELEKVFQPFFSSKLGRGGSGLGLAISYNIVRRHGGDIRVISHPGEGCRFLVELPRRRPALTASPA